MGDGGGRRVSGYIFSWFFIIFLIYIFIHLFSVVISHFGLSSELRKRAAYIFMEAKRCSIQILDLNS